MPSGSAARDYSEITDVSVSAPVRRNSISKREMHSRPARASVRPSRCTESEGKSKRELVSKIEKKTRGMDRSDRTT